MSVRLAVFATLLILPGLLTVSCLSVSDWISYVNSLDYNDNEKPRTHYFSGKISIPQSPIDHTLVDIAEF